MLRVLIGSNRQLLIADWVITGWKVILEPVSFHGGLEGKVILICFCF